ncbi:TetR/AcrR family transcriptional regulator [Amycolatopsis alba]|uniref:TetR/AcrR family transcriptional regulator n=1 Tax=Amycolatopsis alba DSM 44262 TaxID=1125972 RepID=A0A229RXS9_AMYAL|nr:TetR/AcrR family transcriptional regulator [Amycolatopsis alba]OXM51488.1 TetR/AcrR family transcriptional regulator [Amycolatopsis alba DSM 44262]
MTRSRRSDAQRSRTSILDAALKKLGTDPDAGVEAIATAAGVTRQTVYAHFPSRGELLSAVLDRITEEAVAAMDAADLDDGPAADALVRLLEAARRTSGRYPALLGKINSLPAPPPDDRRRHEPVADRLARIIERGKATGEFDARLPTGWLVAVIVKLGHAAAEETDSGRIPHTEATDALHTTLHRILTATKIPTTN